MTALLDIRGLRAGYGRAQVLHGVDLHVNRGEIVALLGSNGAGKSTLNNTVCGIYPAWGGTVTLAGRDLTGAHYRDIVKAGLIQVPEGRKIFPNLTVRENLELGSFTRARERRAQNLDRALALFPQLKDRMAQKAGSMSGGEQQMLAIGRGLMAEPRVVDPGRALPGLVAAAASRNCSQLIAAVAPAGGLAMLAGRTERRRSRWRSRSVPM